MKKIIILTLLATGFTQFAHAQISKNFASELRAWIDTPEGEITGALLSEDKSVPSFPYRKYQCKLPLTGFNTEVGSAGVPVVHGKYKGNATNATMEDIAEKLTVFKKDYTILDSKTDSRLIGDNVISGARKILLVDAAENVKAEITLEKIKTENRLTVSVSKIPGKLAQVLPKNTAPVQIGANFATELLALITTDVETIKGAKYNSGIVTSYFSKLPLQGFDIKLKEVFDNYSIVCEPNGLFSEATMDAIVTKIAPLKKRYHLFDSKTNPELFDLKSGSKPLVRRILLVDISENIKTDIQAAAGYEKLDFTIYKFPKSLKN